MPFNLETKRFDELLAAFPEKRVLVVGDLFADEYLKGQVQRISREAPVLILQQAENTLYPGGAANAAANIASLGGLCDMAGLVGEDAMANRLTGELNRRGVDTGLCLADETRPTTTKTRISAASQQSVTQQIVRVDNERRHAMDDALETRFLAAVAERMPQYDAVLLSDYGNGVLTPRVIAGVMAQAAELGKVVTVDSQRDLREFPGAWIVTPNQPEAEQVVGFAITDQASLMKAGRILLDEAKLRSALITRGGEGMALFEADGNVTQIPAFNRTDVFDVTGAGDTVVGTLTLALSAGATFAEAMVMANVAASIVVRRFGTSVTTRDELKQTWDDLIAHEDGVLRRAL